jgi:hypothetical protein
MPQNLANLGKGCSRAEHPRCERVTQQMCSFECRIQTGAGKSATDDITDSAGTRKPLIGCPQADENPPRRAPRAPLSKVPCQSLANVSRER